MIRANLFSRCNPSKMPSAAFEEKWNSDRAPPPSADGLRLLTGEAHGLGDVEHPASMVMSGLLEAGARVGARGHVDGGRWRRMAADGGNGGGGGSGSGRALWYVVRGTCWLE